jgi:tyrosinase
MYRQEGPMHASSARLTIALAAAFGCVPPALVPTRPADRLPLIEIEIRNTASQSDDYVGTAPAPARIRLQAGPAITAAVPVTLKNLEFQSAPALQFGAGAVANDASLDLTLPADGAWVSFVVRGAPGQNSTRDKDAVIEVLESRTDGIVLGRKALMVAPAPVAPGEPAIELQVGQGPIVDDYVTWRPMPARVRLAAPGADVAVTVRDMAPMTGGRLQVGIASVSDSALLPPTLGATLALTLPADGSWVGFQVAGEFGFPSPDDKDAVLEVVRASTGALLGREGVMVRMRRNADDLSPPERDRWLHAVARVNTAELNNYVLHQQIHAIASVQAHGGRGFLPWHRAFVLRLERELQAVDPAVALHYWRFDQGAPALFAADFIGAPDPAGFAVFAAANPLTAWSIEGLAGIQRNPFFTPAQAPTSLSPPRRDEAQVLALGGPVFDYASVAGSEQDPHDGTHVRTGGGGWMGSVPTAVRDPVFFMLHSNVDRLWAKWQWVHGRKNPTDPLSYNPQGPFPGFATAGGVRLGHFLDDPMWPWDGTTGTVVPGDPLTTRPAAAPGGPLPAPIGGWGPRAQPRPRDMVNFDQWTLLGVAGLGFAYDDVPWSHAP